MSIKKAIKFQIVPIFEGEGVSKKVLASALDGHVTRCLFLNNYWDFFWYLELNIEDVMG